MSLISKKTCCYKCGSEMYRDDISPSMAKYTTRTVYKLSDYRAYDYFCIYSCSTCYVSVKICKNGQVDYFEH